MAGWLYNRSCPNAPRSAIHAGRESGRVVHPRLPERAAFGDTGEAECCGLRARVGAVRLVFRAPQAEELAEGTVGVGVRGVLREQLRELRWRWPRRGGGGDRGSGRRS